MRRQAGIVQSRDRDRERRRRKREITSHRALAADHLRNTGPIRDVSLLIARLRQHPRANAGRLVGGVAVKLRCCPLLELPARPAFPAGGGQLEVVANLTRRPQRCNCWQQVARRQVAGRAEND